MVYADQRLLRRIRECFGFRHTDQKRANQPWTVGNCNRRHLLQTHMCLCQRLFNNLVDLLDMLSRRNLRHNAAKQRVKIDLGRYDIGKNGTSVFHD